MAGSGFAYEAVKRAFQNLEWKKGLSEHHKKIVGAYRSHPSLDNVEYKPDEISPEELLEIEKIDREARRNRMWGTFFWTFGITITVVFVVWFIWWIVLSFSEIRDVVFMKGGVGEGASGRGSYFKIQMFYCSNVLLFN